MTSYHAGRLPDNPGRVSVTYATLTAGFTQVIGNDEFRRAIAFSAGAVGPIIATWDPSPPGVIGLVNANTFDPLILDRATHGAMVTQPLWLASPSGAQTVAIFIEHEIR